MDATNNTCNRVIVQPGGNFLVCQNDKATCPIHNKVQQVEVTDPAEDNVCLSCQ